MLGASISGSMSKRNTVSLIGNNRYTYEDKLKKNLDFTNVTKPINVTNRFSPILKANRILARELEKDIKSLKDMDKEANGISVLSDKIMARSDIYKTLASIRNAQRSVISEQAKIITTSVKLENEIIKNLGGKGNDSNTGNTSNVLSTLHQGILNSSPGISGSGYNEPTVKEETEKAPVYYEEEKPLMSGEEYEEQIEVKEEEKVEEVNLVPEPAREETSLVEDVFAEKANIGDTMNQGSNVIDYNTCLANNKILSKKPKTVIAYDNDSKIYCQAYLMEDGEVIVEDDSLVPIKVLGNVDLDLSNMTAKDAIGGEYDIINEPINNPRIVREWLEK